MIQAIKEKFLKIQVKKKFLNALEEEVEFAISGSREYGSSKGLSNAGMNTVLPMIIQSAIANTSQGLKEGIEKLQNNLDLSKSEMHALLDEAVKETMNKYFKSW